MLWYLICIVGGRLDLTCGGQTWPATIRSGRPEKKTTDPWLCSLNWPWLDLAGGRLDKAGRG